MKSQKWVEVEIKKSLDQISHPHCDNSAMSHLMGRLTALCDIIGVSKNETIRRYETDKQAGAKL